MAKYQQSFEDRFNQVFSEYMKEYLEQKRDEFQGYMLDSASECQSPIEKLMAIGFVYAISMEGWFKGYKVDTWFEYQSDMHSLDEIASDCETTTGIRIYPQVNIGKYRTDFLVDYASSRGGRALGAIECDGHDFHDLTKEQASHDRKRDRYFQSLGLIILRYPGNEIWRNPLKCAADALSILKHRADDENAPRYDGAQR